MAAESSRLTWACATAFSISFMKSQGRSNPFDFATCGAQGFCGVGASFGQPNYGDIDPRVAFAWAPRN